MRQTTRNTHFALIAALIIVSLGVWAWFLIPGLYALSGPSSNNWKGEAINPEDVSWEGITLNNPGQALIKGIRLTEDGICAYGSIPMSLKHDRPQNIGGLWSKVIWTNHERCVHLIEYGYASRQEVDEFKRNSPAPLSTSIPEPAQ